MQLRKIAPLLSFVIAAGCAGQGSSGGDVETVTASTGQKLIGDGPFGLHSVPAANPRVTGLSAPNQLPPELVVTPVAQGSYPLENPTATISNFGYLADGPFIPAAGDLPSSSHKVEASKTEPDKNTYLVLSGQTGADVDYDYGTHFLFQGHELAGEITRINLDADGPHRVTLMASTDKNGTPLPDFDGSTWNPFSQRLLFSAEIDGKAGGLWEATLGYPSVVEDITGAVGRGGYEGIQNDSAGNIWIVEDSSGSKPAATPQAKVPNSFVYRFVPKRKDDDHHGKLQALQAISLQSGSPIVFQDANALTADIGDLHTYGKVFDTKWITLHDTEVDGTASFDANALAKSKGATPFKRPENGQFRPGTNFKEFYFDETGDTDNRTQAGIAYGGFGSIFKYSQSSVSANSGKLTVFYVADANHSGFDNVTFLSKDQVVFVQDAGDTQHGQQNQLDSAFIFDVRADYSDPANQPSRLIAEGRDPSATVDTTFAGMTGFQNEGDNEITGIHYSSGDPSTGGILGAKVPPSKLFKSGWRLFWTQQHGDNYVWEVLKNPSSPEFTESDD
jgi:hypothetical protein